jgi:sec-independent protein translocase protein TatC
MNSPFSHLAGHFEELRKRVLVSCLAIVFCSIIAYIFSEHITAFFIAPLFKAHPAMGKLVYTNLPEAFIAYLKVSLLVGLICSFPVVLYQAWMFTAPGLLDREKKTARQIMLWATMLFVGGVCFAYFIFLPQALSFFMGFAGMQLQAFPKLGGYLTFVARASLAFGLAFEIPFLMVAATKTGIVSSTYFQKKRKQSYLGIIILAMLLTAGDFFSAMLLVIPLFGLYEAGLTAVRMFLSPA